MTMVNLAPKLKTEKGKAQGGVGAAPVAQGEGPMQPPTLYLEHHHLEKLGIKTLPAVGSKLHFHAVAHVGSTSEDQNRGDGGKPKRSMRLHIHQMEIGKEGIGGANDVAQEEESKKGAKSEMEKALKREAGGGKTDSEGEEG